VSRSLVFILLLLAVGASAASAEVRVTGAIDPLSVEVGEGAVLTISVEGGRSIEGDPKWSVPDGISVRDAGQSTNISIANGRFSQSIEIRYVLTPLRAGSYDIGPIEVRSSGRGYTVGPFRLTAVAGARAPVPAPAPGQEPQVPRGAGATPPVLVEMSVEPSEVALGQQVLLSVRFWRRADVTVLDARFLAPETEGFWKEELPPERHAQSQRRDIPYDVTEIRTALFPTRTGALEISPARVHVQYRVPTRDRTDPFSFFGFGGREREEEPSSGSCTVRVRPLPSPSPAGFSGAVGSYRISSGLDRDQAVQGEPITWTVTIEGEGNVSALESPRFPEIPGCRGLDGGSNVHTKRDNDVIGGTKSFSRVLIPEAAGRLELPGLTWIAFNPGDGRYQTLSVPGRRIGVAPASSVADRAPGRIGAAIREIRTRSHLKPLATDYPWRQGTFWFLQIVPAAALIAGFVWRHRREELLKDPVGARMRRAPRRLWSALREVALDRTDPWGRLIRALEDFTADRYGPEVRGLTRPALGEYLRSAGANGEASEQIASLLQRADELRYTPAGQTSRDEIDAALRVASEACARLRQGRARA